MGQAGKPVARIPDLIYPRKHRPGTRLRGCMSARSASTGADPGSRQWPDGGPSRVPNWVYTDPEIFAREQERIFRRAELALCLPRGRNPQSRRLQAQPARHPRGGRRARQRRRGQRAGQPLRASQHAGLQRQSRHGEGVHLPLPPMDLRPRRQADRRAVPPRLSRPGRHARRFPPRGARAASGSRSPRATACVFASFAQPERDARGLSRADDARLFRPRVRRPRAEGARLSAPAHAEQLEADVREHQGPLPRQPAARVPGHVRPVPRSTSNRRSRWTRPAATRVLVSRRGEQQVNEATAQMRAFRERLHARATRACWSRCASSPATPPW